MGAAEERCEAYAAEPGYRRREPEQSALYRTVLNHFDAFLAETTVPAYVAHALRAYLACGVLAHGFLRCRCLQCGRESLVAFSCKDRSFCPSCTARRAAETAAHLVDEVLPLVPLRQYVLAMPPELHHRIARNPELETRVLTIFLEELTGHLRVTSGGAEGDPGFVTFIQRFGSTLNLHEHFHVLALDGADVRASNGRLEFRRAAEPTQAQLEALLLFAGRRVRALIGDTTLDEPPAVEAPLLKLLGGQPGPKSVAPTTKHLTAVYDGFNLHAATCFAAGERDAVERFIRYCSRGPIALGRLCLLPNGNLLYRLKAPRQDDTSHVVFTPQAFLTRLSWLVAQPHIHLIRYHGVLAPNHAWRREIVPGKPATREEPRAGAAKGPTWASLLRRVFLLEALVCSCCGGERRIIAEIEEGPVARKILAHLGLPTTAPRPAQGSLFSTGPPPTDEPEPLVACSDADYDQRLPDSDPFV